MGKALGAGVGMVCKGRLGGAAHRAIVEEIKADAISRKLRVKREVMFKAPGILGIFGAKFADVVAYQGNRIVEIYQVGRITKAGWPVAREIRNSGIIADRAGMDVIFVLYNVP